MQSALMQMAWPSIKLTHPDLFARTCSATSSPMATARGWPAPCATRASPMRSTARASRPWANGTFVISARLAPEKVDAAHKAILDRSRPCRSGWSPAGTAEGQAAEGGRARVPVADRRERRHDDQQRLHRDRRHPFQPGVRRQHQKLTAEQIRDVARKYLRPERLATITILPRALPRPSPPRPGRRRAPAIRKITLDNGACLIRRDPTTPLVAIQTFSLGA